MNEVMTKTTKPASFKQLKWMRDLLDTKDFSEFPTDWVNYCTYVRDAFTLCVGEGYEAGNLNTWLIAHEKDVVTSETFQMLLPRLRAAKDAATLKVKAPEAVTAEEVPEGRYAVPTEDGAANALAFYRVDRPTEGRWAGYVFVKMIVGGGNDQKLPKQTGLFILAKIKAVGAANASAAYGREIGKCGVCGRTLTNDDSRAAGIGPKCAAGKGWG